MSYRLFHTGPAAALFGPSPLLKRDEAAIFADAAALLGRAGEIHRATQEARDAAVEQGREEGRRAVFEERDQALAQALGPMIQSIARGQEELRADIATLAIRAMRRMLAELAPEEVLAGIARSAVSGLDLDTVDRISLSPPMCDPVRAQLPPHLAAMVHGDEALGDGDCIVHARSGKVVASLELQLDRLAKRWGAEA